MSLTTDIGKCFRIWWLVDVTTFSMIRLTTAHHDWPVVEDPQMDWLASHPVAGSTTGKVRLQGQGKKIQSGSTVWSTVTRLGGSRKYVEIEWNQWTSRCTNDRQSQHPCMRNQRGIMKIWKCICGIISCAGCDFSDSWEEMDLNGCQSVVLVWAARWWLPFFYYGWCWLHMPWGQHGWL